MKPLHTVSSLVLLLIAAALDVRACSIPVFRYALERWAPDLYEIDVFYRGSLSPEQLDQVDALEELALQNGGAANLEVVRCHVAETLAPDLAELWQSLDDPPLPCAVIRMPLGRGRPVPIWNGPLADLDPKALADSPARREICRRLLAGDSVVWLIVSLNNAESTEKSRQLLTDLLPRLADDIPLPVGVGQPGSTLASGVPLAVKFSILEISAADPAEAWLLRALRARAPEKSQPGEPLVAAAFGRGRIVELFRAAELEEQLVSDASRFLCGACSCEVKQMNPGFDLLTSTTWETSLFESGSAPSATAMPDVVEAVESQIAGTPAALPPRVVPPTLPAAKTIRSAVPSTADPGSTSPVRFSGAVAYSIIAVGLLTLAAAFHLHRVLRRER
jgi:hypothetical protein